MSRPLCAALAAIGIGLPAIATADHLPMMDHEKPVHCVPDKEGAMWRIQCDDVTKVCLYAADQELDSTGARAKALERTRECDRDLSFDRTKLEQAGYTFVPGRADAPWGWTRDERGRVFQINFDLHKRFYFGVGYTPQKLLDHIDNPLQNKRSSLDFGLFVYNYLSDGTTPTLHRIRLLEGTVRVEPFSAVITVAHYDVSRRFLDPLLRFTTFVGEPARHDLKLDLGMWTEAGGLEIHPAGSGNSTIWKHVTAMGTLDLWQSAKLDSFVRIRTGVGIEGQNTDANGYRTAIVPQSALDIDLVADPAGFHNVRFEISHEMPRYLVPIRNDQKLAQRIRANVQYEAIVLAINDQPLTLKLAAGGEKRDDIMGVPDRWAFVMDAGLRFSLWAPPRPRS
jgi:hypothetical protein